MPTEPGLHLRSEPPQALPEQRFDSQPTWAVRGKRPGLPARVYTGLGLYQSILQPATGKKLSQTRQGAVMGQHGWKHPGAQGIGDGDARHQPFPRAGSGLGVPAGSQPWSPIDTPHGGSPAAKGSWTGSQQPG